MGVPGPQGASKGASVGSTGTPAVCEMMAFLGFCLRPWAIILDTCGVQEGSLIQWGLQGFSGFLGFLRFGVVEGGMGI